MNGDNLFTAIITLILGAGGAFFFQYFKMNQIKKQVDQRDEETKQEIKGLDDQEVARRINDSLHPDDPSRK